MSSEVKITVAIPVGPKEHHRRWLKECIDSVLDQTVRANEILIVNDSNEETDLRKYFAPESDFGESDYECNHRFCYHLYSRNGEYINQFQNPCVLGVPAVFNIGIAVAENEYVLQLGSDDTLAPTAIEEAKKYISNCSDKQGMYNFSCKDITTGEEYNWYNHANVMSKKLWEEVDGYHPFTSIGGTDAAFNSICMVHFPNRMHKVAEGTPLYLVRSHENNYTKESASRYWSFMNVIRDDLTREWKAK